MFRWYNFCAIVPFGLVNKFGYFCDGSFMKVFFMTLGIVGTIFQVSCLIATIINFKKNLEEDYDFKKENRKRKIQKVKFKNFIKNFNLQEFFKKEINLKELFEKWNRPIIDPNKKGAMKAPLNEAQNS